MRASKSNIFPDGRGSIDVVRSQTKAKNYQNCTSHSKHVEGHKPHRDNCFSEKIVCNLCSTSGYTDWHSLLRPYSQCLRENIVCTRLLPLVWSTDCDPKQKTFMNTMLADREKYPYRVPIPDCPTTSSQCVPLNSSIGSTLTVIS